MAKEVIFAAEHCCIRVIKEATALKNLGHKVHLLTIGELKGPVIQEKGRYLEGFESWRHCKDQETAEREIKDLSSRSNVFHVHVEPYWISVRIRQILANAYIVTDVHDSNYWRFEGKEWPEEDVAVDCSDAFVVPSETCRNELRKRTKKPISVIPSACPETWYRYNSSMDQGGLASQGGHTIPDLGTPWRDFTEIYEKLIELGIDIYAYSPQFKPYTMDEKLRSITAHYANIKSENVSCHLGNVDYGLLLDMLSNHNWNLVGNWKNGKYLKVWDYALPNKLYDAVASGIPSFVINCPEAGRIVEKYGIGFVGDKPEDLKKNWDRHTKARKSLMLKRKFLSMESFINRAVELYDKEKV